MRALLAVVLIAIALAAGARAEQRPLEEMGGRCRDYRMNLGPEFAAWRQPALPRTAARHAEEAAVEPLSLRQRYAVTLLPASEVVPVLPAEQPAAGQGHAGLLAFRVPANGFYRISLGGEVGVELAFEGVALAPREFEMQSQCDSIRASLEYTLRAGRLYTLQITSPVLTQVELLVTARR